MLLHRFREEVIFKSRLLSRQTGVQTAPKALPIFSADRQNKGDQLHFVRAWWIGQQLTVSVGPKHLTSSTGHLTSTALLELKSSCFTATRHRGYLSSFALEWSCKSLSPVWEAAKFWNCLYFGILPFCSSECISSGFLFSFKYSFLGTARDLDCFDSVLMYLALWFFCCKFSFLV